MRVTEKRVKRENKESERRENNRVREKGCGVGCVGIMGCEGGVGCGGRERERTCE
jgi:nitrogenase subunit NifH